MVGSRPILDDTRNLEIRVHQNHEASHVHFEEDAQNGNGSEIKKVNRGLVFSILGDKNGIDVLPVVMSFSLVIMFIFLGAPIVYLGSLVENLLKLGLSFIGHVHDPFSNNALWVGCLAHGAFGNSLKESMYVNEFVVAVTGILDVRL